MGKVFLAANYVSASGSLFTPAELENSGHLQIVYLQDSGVYEEIEVQARMISKEEVGEYAKTKVDLRVVLKYFVASGLC